MKKSDVVKYFGSGQAVADALGISRSAVSMWPSEIPALRAYEIERITNGALKVDGEHSQKSAA